MRRSAFFIGCLCALGATMIWSGNFVVSRGLGEVFPPVRLALLRWITATVAILPFGLAAALRQRALLRRHLGYVLASALLGVSAFNTLIYIAGRHTEAVNMALIATSTPVFLMTISALFLGERVTARTFAGAGVAVCGVVLLVTRGDLARLLELRFNPGDALMLLAAFLFSTYSILLRRRPAGLDQGALLTATFALGAAGLVPWALWEAWALPPGSGELTPQVLGAVLYIGVGASVAAYFLWGRALEQAGPTVAGLIYYTLPLFSGLEAALLLGEPMTWVHAASGGLIVGGIALATLRRGN
ncbi:DMT family transporter [Desulfocurvus sp.]|jgi:drug/metabolite transporter (DMT)-like permease|uniref:DMT family transporter n=1 Tax=Desulfocurvus sp. TaxID=2871698 RepID=UPI0025BE67CB|nr:DMT family transporter [Desulfocurvus sp.]MCK9240167.1 DMT family transporter [Desulfocurvus sp.]